MDFNPISNFRSRIDNIRAHPFQALIRGVAGGLGGPLAGGLVGRGLQMWNNRQFDSHSNAATDRLNQQGQEASDEAMGRPLKGPLGQFGNNNSALAGALMSARPPIGGWNMSQVFGQQPGFSNSQNPGGLLGFLPQSGQQTQGGPNLNALDQLLAQANGPSGGASGGGGGGLGGGGFAGGMNWGGGSGAAMLSNLGMAGNVMNFGGWGGSPTSKGMLSDFKPG